MKKVLALAVVVLMVLSLVACGGGSPIEPTRSELSDSMDLTPEQEEAMIEVFDSVNLGEVLRVETWEFADWRQDGSVGFVVHCTRTDGSEPIIVWIDESSSEVVHIIFRGNTLMYQGKQVAGLTDDHIRRQVPSEPSAELRSAARTLMREFLDSPEMAGSPRGTLTEEGNYTIISGVVTSLNERGERVRKPFRIVWDRYLPLENPLSIVIDGEELIR